MNVAQLASGPEDTLGLLPNVRLPKVFSPGKVSRTADCVVPQQMEFLS